MSSEDILGKHERSQKTRLQLEEEAIGRPTVEQTAVPGGVGPVYTHRYITPLSQALRCVGCLYYTISRLGSVKQCQRLLIKARVACTQELT